MAPLAMIGDYYVKIDKTEITREELVAEGNPATERRVSKISYESAHVFLVHTMALKTSLTYVGEWSKAWVHQVLEAIPINLLVKSQREV